MQTPPHDLDVERSLLTTMAFSDPKDNALLFPRLSEDCFMHPNHKVIFGAMRSLASS